MTPQKVEFVRHFEDCPLRPGHPFKDLGAGQPRWRMTGKDRTCAFCGSMDPEDFYILCLDPNNFDHLEVNDSRETVRFGRPGISNATEGAIKVKVAHIQTALTKDQIKVVNAAIHFHVLKFREKWRKMQEEAKEKAK